jgi:hypothetical protein
MVKTKTYAPPKGGVGTNNVELSEESDADLLGQHDTTENEDIVLTVKSNIGIPLRFTIELKCRESFPFGLISLTFLSESQASPWTITILASSAGSTLRFYIYWVQ